MKIRVLFISAVMLLFSVSALSALDSGDSFTKSYRTGDQLDYPLRSKLAEYKGLIEKKDVIYKIIDSGNNTDFDVQIDNFTFRLTKGDKFQTYYEIKENKDAFQSYIIRYTISSEIADLRNNRIEISYNVTKVEKFYKKGLKSDYETVTKFPWE